MDTCVSKVSFICLYKPTCNKDKEANIPIQLQLNPNKNLSSERVSQRKYENLIVFVSDRLNEIWRHWQSGECSKKINAKVPRKRPKHLLPLILNHLKIMIKRMGSLGIIISNSC